MMRTKAFIVMAAAVAFVFSGCDDSGPSGDDGGGTNDASGVNSGTNGGTNSGTNGGTNDGTGHDGDGPYTLGPGGTTGLDESACPREEVLCVNDDDDPPGTQEFETIQAAVDAAGPGDTVLVFNGQYRGFRVEHGGTPDARLVISAQSIGVIINEPEPGSGESIHICNASYVTVEGFIVPRNGAEGMGIAAHCATPDDPMHGVIIRNNVVYGSKSVNIYASEVADSIIEGNIAYGSEESHGMYVCNAGSDNTIVRYNQLYENAVNGLHFNGDASIGGDGLHQGLTVEGNIIYANEANGIDADGVYDSAFLNNVIYANGRHAIRVFQIDASGGARNLVIANNTLVDNEAWGIKLTADLGGHVIFNNIILGNRGNICTENEDFASDHNVVEDVEGFSVDGEDTVMDLAAWRQIGHGINTVTSTREREFTNPDGHDYTLKDGAAAKDSCVESFEGKDAPSYDAWGESRPAGEGMDCGAFETFR